jgi:hypothetical protein
MNDGMPAPLEIPEEEGADNILYTIRKEKTDHQFPLVIRWLIRLALVLPKPVLDWILKREVPPLIASKT